MAYKPTYDELLRWAIGHLDALLKLDCGKPIWKVQMYLMAVTARIDPPVNATLLNEYYQVGDRAGYLNELKRHTLAAVQRALDAAPTDAP